MRYTTTALALLAASAACSTAAAQTVELIAVGKGKNFVQSGPATVVPSAPGCLTHAPFEFRCSVAGTDINLLDPAPVASGPFANIVNGGELSLKGNANEWMYGTPPFFEEAEKLTLSALDLEFPNGTYMLTLQGATVPLALAGDIYPASAPLLMLSGGSWSADGHYEIAAGAELTIATSAFAEYGTHALDAVYVEVFNSGVVRSTLNLSSENPSNSASLAVPAGILVPGDYRIDAGFITCSQAGGGGDSFPEALVVATYSANTRIRLRVLPPTGDTERFWFDIGKTRWHRQLDAATVRAGTASDMPFEFWANAGGTGIECIPRVNGPISNPEPGHNFGFLGAGADGIWRYGYPLFEGWRTGTQAELDSLFANGSYSCTGADNDLSVALTGDLYPSQAPRVTVSGGNWIAPGLCLVPAAGFSLTTTAHPQWGQNTEDEVLLAVDGGGFFAENLKLASEDPANGSISMIVPGSAVAPRTELSVSAEFFGLSTSFDGWPDYFALASFGMSTEFTIRVRPRADLNGDGIVGGVDLGMLLGVWGPCPSCEADLDGNGVVSGSDLGRMLGDWG